MLKQINAVTTTKSKYGLSDRADWAVIGTDYGHWHETIREASIAPLCEQQVSLDELELFIDGRMHDAVRWVAPPGAAVFPKIGVCSWKCFPWLLPPLPEVNLFNRCSRRMKTVLAHWLSAGEAPILRFFPFIDYSGVDEYRYKVKSGQALPIRKISRKANGDRSFDIEAREFAQRFAPLLDQVIIDVAVKKTGDSCSMWIVELNPVASPSHFGV